MLIQRDTKITTFSPGLICVVADGIYTKHDCIPSLVHIDENMLAFTSREQLPTERKFLKDDLAASLGASFKVVWDEHLERIEIALA